MFRISLFRKRNKAYFLLVYRHNNLFGMLGEHSKSLLITRLCLRTFLIFSQHPAWVSTPLSRRNGALYCSNIVFLRVAASSFVIQAYPRRWRFSKGSLSPIMLRENKCYACLFFYILTIILNCSSG